MWLKNMMNLFELLLALKIAYAEPKPTPEPIQAISVEQKNPDPNVVVLENYLNQKKSPLASSAGKFIEIAETYSLDWTLLPAIAGVESGFETAGNTSDFNPFGYMCSGHPCAFESFDEAIARVGKTLGTGRAYQKFRDTGSISVLAVPYNYVSPEDWTRKVQHFQEEIKP